ncbi:MAG: lysophospholipase [Bacteroidota bacterium]
MKEKEGKYIVSSDGFQLNYSINEAESPIAMVCVFHGFGEHLGRYERLVSYLNTRQISCLSMDFRGHGRSQGKRGHLPSIQQMLDDMEEALKLARVTELEVPLFLFGHSLGGCMVLNYALRKPVMELSGFIASSPWLTLAFDPPGWKVKLAKPMSKLWPKLSQPANIDHYALAKNPEMVKTYEDDPLVHNQMTARFFVEVTEAGMYVKEKISELELEGLVYHGTSDRITDFSTTKEISSRSGRIQFRELTDFYHDLHSNLGHESVFQLTSEWISNRVKTLS